MSNVKKSELPSYLCVVWLIVIFFCRQAKRKYNRTIARISLKELTQLRYLPGVVSA